MFHAGSRPMGRLFYWVGMMLVLVSGSQAARPAAPPPQSGPAMTTVSEGLFANKSGAEKKDAAMSFLQNALAMTDAVAARDIVDPEKFRSGISMAIDGVVLCLNASTWAKSGAPVPAGIPTAK